MYALPEEAKRVFTMKVNTPTGHKTLVCREYTKFQAELTFKMWIKNFEVYLDKCYALRII